MDGHCFSKSHPQGQDVKKRAILFLFLKKNDKAVKLSGAALCLGQACPGYNVPAARSTNGAAHGQHGNNSPQGKSKAAPCGMDLLC